MSYKEILTRIGVTSERKGQATTAPQNVVVFERPLAQPHKDYRRGHVMQPTFIGTEPGAAPEVSLYIAPFTRPDTQGHLETHTPYHRGQVANAMVWFGVIGERGAQMPVVDNPRTRRGFVSARTVADDLMVMADRIDPALPDDADRLYASGVAIPAPNEAAVRALGTFVQEYDAFHEDLPASGLPQYDEDDLHQPNSGTVARVFNVLNRLNSGETFLPAHYHRDIPPSK